MAKSIFSKEQNFSGEQLALIKELDEIVKKCKAANIKIAGLFEYEVFQYTNVKDYPYILIS